MESSKHIRKYINFPFKKKHLWIFLIFSIIYWGGYLLLKKRSIEIQKTPTLKHPTLAVEIDTKDEILKRIGEKYGIDWKILKTICIKESQCNPNRIGDNGQSYGAFQIHLPSHPEVTKEQAMDFEWSAEWTAKRIIDLKKRYPNANLRLIFKNHNGLGKKYNNWYVEDCLKIYKKLSTG